MKKSIFIIVNFMILLCLVSLPNTANFTGANKYGIFRKIPWKNTVVRANGTKSHNMAKISKIEVNEDWINDGGRG